MFGFICVNGSEDYPHCKGQPAGFEYSQVRCRRHRALRPPTFFTHLVFSGQTKAIRHTKRAAFKAKTAGALWPVEEAV